MTVLRNLWADVGQIGVERFGFPHGAIREAALVATVICWAIGAALLVGSALGWWAL